MGNLGWIAGAVSLAAAVLILIALRQPESRQRPLRVVAVVMLIAAVVLTFTALFR